MSVNSCLATFLMDGPNIKSCYKNLGCERGQLDHHYGPGGSDDCKQAQRFYSTCT